MVWMDLGTAYWELGFTVWTGGWGLLDSEFNLIFGTRKVSGYVYTLDSEDTWECYTMRINKWCSERGIYT